MKVVAELRFDADAIVAVILAIARRADGSGVMWDRLDKEIRAFVDAPQDFFDMTIEVIAGDRGGEIIAARAVPNERFVRVLTDFGGGE